MEHNRKGFTLIELAIVVTIIGFLMAGILAGTSILDTSKRQIVISDLKKFQTAFDEFRVKYRAIPGDMRPADAQGEFGPAVSGGDGNGIIAYGTIEPYQAWLHLSRAGFIDRAFTGVMPAATSRTDVNKDIFPAPYANSGYAFMYLAPYGSGYVVQNSITMGESLTGPNVMGNALTTQEAEAIDLKMDDGHPGTARIIAKVSGSSNNCINIPSGSTDPTTYTYQQSVDNTKQCFLVYFMEDVNRL